MEDFVTWVDTSKIKRTVMQYNNEVCFLDYPLLITHFTLFTGGRLRSPVIYPLPRFRFTLFYSFLCLYLNLYIN